MSKYSTEEKKERGNEGRITVNLADNEGRNFHSNSTSLHTSHFSSHMSRHTYTQTDRHTHSHKNTEIHAQT
jgi:hypothetical protein